MQRCLTKNGHSTTKSRNGFKSTCTKEQKTNSENITKNTTGKNSMKEKNKGDDNANKISQLLNSAKSKHHNIGTNNSRLQNVSKDPKIDSNEVLGTNRNCAFPENVRSLIDKDRKPPAYECRGYASLYSTLKMENNFDETSSSKSSEINVDQSKEPVNTVEFLICKSGNEGFEQDKSTKANAGALSDKCQDSKECLSRMPEIVVNGCEDDKQSVVAAANLGHNFPSNGFWSRMRKSPLFFVHRNADSDLATQSA